MFRKQSGGGSNNEPAGMTLISSRQFNALNEGGWTDSGGANMSIVADATAPESPSNVLQMHMPAGFGEGGGPGSGDFAISPTYRTIYARYSGKFSAGWQGSSSGVDKTFYLYNAVGPSIYFNMDGSGVVAKHPQIAGQDILHGGIGSDPTNPDWTTNLSPGYSIPLGSWHTVECVIVGNTAGNSDGSLDWWVNGTHVASYSGIQFIAGACLWNLFHYTMLYSGSVGTNPVLAQDLFWDSIYLSGK